MSGAAGHSHASFTADGVEDARRGAPASDLAAYGTARGLEPMGSVLVGHVAGLNPLWVDHVFNVLRGELGDGRFGTVQHELHEVGLADDGSPTQPGEYWGRRSSSRPGLGSLIGIRRDPPNEPFGAQAMWLPSTGVKVLVPEAALLPRMVAVSAPYAPLTAPSLGPWAPSFRMVSSAWADDAMRAAFAGATGPVLESIGATFCRVEVAHGALGIRVDGFRDDPADLDRLVDAACALARVVTELGRPWWVEGDPDQPLWAFDRSTHPPGYRSFEGDHDRSGMDALERDAARFAMTVEDPVALHRRFPRLAVPGTSMGVLRGTLPSSSVTARLSWHTQSHPGSSAYLRRAAIVTARPDTPSLPVGGELVTETDMYVACVDGVGCCWTRTNSEGRLGTEDLMHRALETFRRTGVLAEGG